MERDYTILNCRGQAIGSARAVNKRAAVVAFNRANHGMPIDLATDAFCKDEPDELPTTGEIEDALKFGKQWGE